MIKTAELLNKYLMNQTISIYFIDKLDKNLSWSLNSASLQMGEISNTVKKLYIQ